MKNSPMSEAVRVLCLFTLLDRGGAETMCMNIYRNIDRTKVQFDFLVYYPQRGKYEDEIELLGGHVYRIPHLEPKNIVDHIKAARAFFKEHPEYRIVHDHMGENGALICREAKRAGVSTIIFHAHTDYYPVIIWKQCHLLPTKMPMLSTTECKLRVLLPILMSSATDFFACGENATKVFRRKQSEAVIIKNGIDVSKYAFNETIRERVRKEHQCENAFVVGNVARLNDNKNQSFAIDIMKELVNLVPNAQLWLVGDGNKCDELKKKAESLGLKDKVLFLGIRSDVNELLQAMDVFLFPSKKEGLPVACIEAQTAGLPCVFSDGFDSATDVTGNCRVLSLKEGPVMWASEINKLQGTVRENKEQAVSNAGYDIRKTAAEMQSFYLSRANV